MTLPLNHKTELRALCIDQLKAEAAATAAIIKRSGWQAGKARYAVLNGESRALVKSALEKSNASTSLWSRRPRHALRAKLARLYSAVVAGPAGIDACRNRIRCT